MNKKIKSRTNLVLEVATLQKQCASQLEVLVLLSKAYQVGNPQVELKLNNNELTFADVVADMIRILEIPRSF